MVYNNAFLTFFANFLIVRKQKNPKYNVKKCTNHQWNFHFSYATGYILCANFICTMNNSSGFKSVLQSCHVPFLTNALLHHIVVPKTDITMHWWKMVLMCKNWSLWSQVKSYLNRLMISYSGCKQWYLNFNYIKRWAKKLRFLYNEDIMEIIDNLISSHKLSPMSLPNSFLYIYINIW